ncbi:class I SAM-dependent methyltransferase [Aureivirga sp. CE67]|uniref:class I SAM-dependent methyltransferase n=1 Tax=Aureivirga sp. CE67 TaxID=1788983 RepID=UPI0018CAC156|nr:class I SAM-dependent methyltransferase [Aureivirga sp. CE67]
MGEYAIHGGDKGKRRLQILSETLEEETTKFIQKVGISKGMKCLDLGCGGGNVSILLSKLIGEKGEVIGYDIDERKIALAKETMKELNISNIKFEVKNVNHFDEKEVYDIIYSRFLLSHLKNPAEILQKMYHSLKPNGKILIEETDFSGHFSVPRSKDFDSYVSLYQKLLEKRGTNANLGKELFSLLNQSRFKNIDFSISQVAHNSGNGKLMAEITFEGISEALIKDKIISQNVIEEIQSGLIEFRKRKDTIMSLPRIFQFYAFKQ